MLKTPPATQCIPMSKPQIVKAIRLSAKKLGRNPSLRDLRLLGRVSEQVLYKRFGGLGLALAAAGLEATRPGFSLPESTLLLDWAAVARKLGKVPSVHEYESSGRFSNMPFHTLPPLDAHPGSLPPVRATGKTRARLAGCAQAR